MDVRLVKSTAVYTWTAKHLEKETLHEEVDEIGQYESIDEAIYYSQANMIKDICDLQRTPKAYGFCVMEYYDLDWERSSNNCEYINGFNHQIKSNSPCGFDIYETRYTVHVLRW